MRSIYLLLYRLLYNELAWAYDAVSWAVSLGRWDAWRRAALPFVRGERVLEVGFGTGALLPVLQRGRRGVIGIEPSAAMQRIARQKLRRRGVTVPCVQGTGQKLPFCDKSFDTIVCAFPSSYILDPSTHQEFARCLRPGGRILIVEVVLADAGPLLSMLFHMIFPATEGAFERLEHGVERSGLAIEEHVVGQETVRPVVIVVEAQGSQ